MTDQIADLLVRLRNAAAVNKLDVVMPFSKMKEAILNILKNEGFLKDVKVLEDKKIKNIKVTIASNKMPSHLKQISKPGHRIYLRAKEIKVPLRGFGLAIVSTSQGMLTAKEANKKGLGGELICEVW